MERLTLGYNPSAGYTPNLWWFWFLMVSSIGLQKPFLCCLCFQAPFYHIIVYFIAWNVSCLLLYLVCPITTLQNNCTTWGTPLSFTKKGSFSMVQLNTAKQKYKKKKHRELEHTPFWSRLKTGFWSFCATVLNFKLKLLIKKICRNISR